MNQDSQSPLWSDAILGYLSIQKGDINQGQEIYQKAIKKYPQHENWLKNKKAIAFFQLGIKQLNQGKIATAINNFSHIDKISVSIEKQLIPWLQEHQKPWPYTKFNCISHLEKLKPQYLQWPKITIVTPSFNQGQYLEQTILSVINQNYPNLEYIIVDNQSPDQTLQILNKYQNQVTKIIIEPDTGQSNAINKGFSQSTGELMTWLNSDDMLAPGALHIAALNYLEKPYDLIAGICLIHENNRITSIIKSQATPEDFTTEKLAQIGKLWSNGHYFRQPEVIFNRNIWRKIGSHLNEQLQYAIDYELWLKMAQNQAKLTILDYPLAFFRTHKQQKTADYQFNTSCVLEQIAVRNKFYIPQIIPPRQQEIFGKLNQFITIGNKNILVVTEKINISQFNKDNSYIYYCDDIKSLDNFNNYDAVILLALLKNELSIIEYLKKHNYDKLLIGWFWYNNCQYYDNAVIAEQVDISIPANQFLADILVNESTLVTDALPIACLQKNIPDDLTLKVSQKQGFYIELPQYINQQNKRLINIIKQAFPDSIIIKYDDNLSESEKLQHRLSYPVALCLPMTHEIPDTLLTTLLYEQIPIITTDIWELDRLFPQEWLFPVINLANLNIDYIKQLYQEATLTMHTKKILSRLKTTILTDNLLPKRIDQILTFCYHLLAKEGSIGD